MSSPWPGGRGDVVREVADARAHADLAFGVYSSPWDRNHPAYGRDDAAYNGLFAAQLEALLTGYGPPFEVWFDGANGDRSDPAKFQKGNRRSKRLTCGRRWRRWTAAGAGSGAGDCLEVPRVSGRTCDQDGAGGAGVVHCAG